MGAEADRKEGFVVASSLWLAADPSKRWGELFFLLYTPFWLTLCLGLVVPYKLYEDFMELEYLLLALVSAVPAFLIPIFFVCKADANIPWKDRYWVKVAPAHPSIPMGDLSGYSYLYSYQMTTLEKK